MKINHDPQWTIQPMKPVRLLLVAVKACDNYHEGLLCNARDSLLIVYVTTTRLFSAPEMVDLSKECFLFAFRKYHVAH